MGRGWLGAGEQEVVTLRPHAKTIGWRIVGLLGLAATFGAGLRAIPDELSELLWVLLAVEGSAVLLFVLLPVLRWRTTRYVLTNRRVLTRRGIFGRVGRQVPLDRIGEVGYRRGLIDRLLGCGTLRVIAADGQPLELADIPDVKRVQLVVEELRHEPSHLAAYE